MRLISALFAFVMSGCNTPSTFSARVTSPDGKALAVIEGTYTDGKGWLDRFSPAGAVLAETLKLIFP